MKRARDRRLRLLTMPKLGVDDSLQKMKHPIVGHAHPLHHGERLLVTLLPIFVEENAKVKPARVVRAEIDGSL